jgi:hypothetical protein
VVNKNKNAAKSSAKTNQHRIHINTTKTDQHCQNQSSINSTNKTKTNKKKINKNYKIKTMQIADYLNLQQQIEEKS